MTEAIIFLLVGILFIGIAGYLFYIYYSRREYSKGFAKKGEGHSEGSYKGFWYRNKYTIAIFMAYTSVIISLSFIGISINLFL